MTLFHYTDWIGLNGILRSGLLLPSTRATNPKDVRYDEGQYFTDVRPGTMSAARLSRLLVGHPFRGRSFTHYLEVDVAGLPVQTCRPGVLLVPGRQPLDVRSRIVGQGVS